MLKVCVIVDKEHSAIDRIAQGMRPHHDNLQYVVCDFHPKRPSRDQLEQLEYQAKDADIIDAQYFKSVQKAREIFPWLKQKKTILTHHNPYSIHEETWSEYDMVIGNSRKIYEKLSHITSSPLEYVGNSIDMRFWEYNGEWEPNNNVIMVANRIEPKKGILPVAKACAKLNLNFHLVGSISDASYAQEIFKTPNVVFHEKISDHDLLNLYHKSTIYVLNSVDNFESSGQPLLEAMATGVPVLTRNIGIAPEVDNGENMVVRQRNSYDVDDIEEHLGVMLADKKMLSSIRDNAWNTVKSKDNERRAYTYQKLYRKTLFNNSVSASIVMPVKDNPDTTRKALNAVAEQTYKDIELIVCDDGLDEENYKVVSNFSLFVNFPVKYLRTAKLVADENNPEAHKDYGLARARNRGAIESTGQVIIFIDQRQVPEKNAVEEFMKYAKPRYWVFGNKGANKTSFVENFSAIYRRDFVVTGMFNERCDKYGALSEEIRKRIRYQGIKTEYIKDAKASPTGKSASRTRKRQDIIASKNMCWKMYQEFGEN